MALGLVAIFQYDPDTAWPALQRAIELNPSSAPAYQALNLGNCLEALGDLEVSKAAYARALDLGLSAIVLAFMVRVHVKLKDTTAARAILALGEPEHAMDWIERGYAQNEYATHWVNVEGWLPFENTRNHPRFQSFLEQENRRFRRGQYAGEAPDRPLAQRWGLPR